MMVNLLLLSCCNLTALRDQHVGQPFWCLIKNFYMEKSETDVLYTEVSGRNKTEERALDYNQRKKRLAIF